MEKRRSPHVDGFAGVAVSHVGSLRAASASRSSNLLIECWILVAGASLALILQTSSRFAGGVGVGELGLALCTALGMAKIFLSLRSLRTGFKHSMPLVLIGYFVLVLTPFTLIHSAFGTPGSSLRDLAAYGLCFSFIYVVAGLGVDVRKIAGRFVFAALAIVSYQYFMGGASAWYGDRFTGGAINPNQLALYMICGAVLSAAFSKRWLRVGSTGLFMFFAVASKSDAVVLCIYLILLFYATAVVVPHRHFLAGGTFVVMGTVVFVLGLWESIASALLGSWASADEGLSRTVLYVNGIKAWWSSLPSILVGHGAGSFSGLLGPFQEAEAHNTPIDILTIGGLLGLVMVYYLPIVTVWRLYQKRRALLLALGGGLLLFSLFHFVARHPLWWFTWYFTVCLAAAPSISKKEFG